MTREIGLPTRKGRRVSLEEGAAPGATRCPACGEPLFVWLETEGYGPREDQVIDRCENCGLVAARDAVPSPDHAVDALLLGREQNGSGVRCAFTQAFDPTSFLAGLERFDVRWKVFETNVPVAVEV